MARTLALILLMALTGCVSTQERLSRAETVKALAQEKPSLPDLPPSCTALTGRAYPKVSEAWVITQKRWEYIADYRDEQAKACGSAWNAYRAKFN